MDSTPAPIPTSIIPAEMALAMSTQAMRPDEHCRLRALTPVPTGKPALRAAARYSVAPAPGDKTLPTAMSWTSSGLIPDRLMIPSKAKVKRSAAAVSLRRPLPPLQKGVRRQAVMTTCCGSLVSFLRFCWLWYLLGSYIVGVLLGDGGSALLTTLAEVLGHHAGLESYEDVNMLMLVVRDIQSRGMRIRTHCGIIR